MYGDARLGTLDWVEWVTLTNGSLDYTFPLVRQSIQRQPMFSFPQTTQQGPIDRPSLDPRLSYVSLLNDLTGGLGYQTIEPTDSLARYFWGSLETRWKGYVTLPQKTTATGLAGPTTSGLPVMLSAATPSTGTYTGQRLVYLHNASGTGPSNVPLALVGSSNVSAGTVTLTGSAGAILTNLVAHGAAIGAVFYNGVRRVFGYSTDGLTFTATTGTTFDLWGLLRFDNKLWSFDATSRILYSCVDPTQGIFVAPSTNPNGWRVMSDALQLAPMEFVRDLVAWRDNQGNAAIYVITSRRMIGYDSESQEFVDYDTFAQFGSFTSEPGAKFVQWPRDRQLYAIFPTAQGEATRWVRQYTGTQSEVGPVHSGQLPPPYFLGTRAIAANAHHVLVWYTDGQATGSSQGVLAYNEQGGWHPVFTGPTSGKTITGGGYDNGKLYITYSNNTTDVVDLPDSSAPTILIPSTSQATSGSITLAEIDCGAPGVWKLGAYLYIDARKSDNSYGLPTNSALTINAPLADGVALGNYLILHDSDTFPAIIGLDTATMSLTAQGGMPFRRFQASLVLGKTATTDQSARLVDVALYYDLWREQRYAYQFAIDFTDTAWGYPRSLAGGLDRGAAIAELLSLQLTKRRFKVTFGGSGDRQVVIPAAEIIVASRADDNQRGIFPCTIRDVSAPASG